MAIVEFNINESELTNALIDSSMLVADRLNPKARTENARYTKEAIDKLWLLFVDHHNSFSDMDFLLLKRFLLKINEFDSLIEEDQCEEDSMEADFYKRCRKVNYKSIDRFDGDGKLIEE